jgi:hypothetical protein
MWWKEDRMKVRLVVRELCGRCGLLLVSGEASSSCGVFVVAIGHDGMLVESRPGNPGCE